MTKLLVMPTKSNISECFEKADGIMVGIKGLSVNMPDYFNLDEVSKYTSSTNKEIFVVLNKNMHNSDLELLEDIMLKLNDFKISGLIYYDIAVYNIHKRLNLSYDLVWGKEHATTNYMTANYWYKKGVNYSYLSSDITINEIIEIKENTNIKLMVSVFGYLPMFMSPRHLVENYKNKFKLYSDSEIYYMQKEGKEYPVIDSEIGTEVYSNNILEGLKESLILKDKKIDYLVLNSILIPNFKEVVDVFKEVTVDNIEEKKNILENLIGSNTDKGFLYKETVYKVKKNG